MIPAILSDLDGVLVDSGRSVELVWRAWAVERGIDPGLVERASHGVPSRQVVERVAPGLDAAREAVLVDGRHAATGGVALPGARELLTAHPPDRLAVVTSGTRLLALARLEAAGLPLPRVLVTADDVTRGKPDPEPYLAAAGALGVPAGDCVVLEDAPAGLRAARAAGMAAWAVTTTHAAEELRPDADRVAASVAELLR